MQVPRSLWAKIKFQLQHDSYDMSDTLIRAPDKSVYWKNYLLNFSSKTCIMGTQKNRLNETVLLSTQNTSLN